ncbi:MAG: hypothetical protein DME32_04875 [Verrucomicrobia bacterium]|nr:MAG: hypothetical protein DME32_04875 [Verrucomicrobiota bacterium]
MQRLLLAVVVLLAALLLARDPYVDKADAFFLDWLLRNTPASGDHAPLTVVEIGGGPTVETQPNQQAPGNSPESHPGAGTVSPLEFALFFQGILEFKPTVVAVEPPLKWRERDKNQEQVFLDQAMRVPKLLLSAELTSTPDPDAPPAEIPGFPHVGGRRGDLPTFTGIQRQPDEDLRLISTIGYVNLPDVTTTRVPLLFNYRGEVIPAFALQAFLTWARIPMSEVQIEVGSHIALPGGRKIPINWDGTLIVNPNWSKLGRRFALNELLLLAQQRQKNSALESLHEDLILARTPSNLLAPADVFAATIATLQSNHFVRRVSVLFDGAVVLFIALLASRAVRASRIDLVLGLIAFTAGYCLIAFTVMARYAIWVPGLVPLGTAWLLGLLAFFWPRPKHRAEATEIAVPPPAP